MATNTYGGGRDQTAIIGHAPESRDWTPGDPTFHPYIGFHVRIEAYVTIDAGVERETRIGPRAWLMKGCHVGHDAWIGADCELAPHCVIGGYVTIGDRVRVGMGAIIKPRVTVGDGAVIGCGAVVIRDVPAGATVVGNPARRITRLEPSTVNPAKRIERALGELEEALLTVKHQRWHPSVYSHGVSARTQLTAMAIAFEIGQE